MRKLVVLLITYFLFLGLANCGIKSPPVIEDSLEVVKNG
tara:strand:- start:633 stop:749 length:117 start_codon:yes stop_codon:yes gene_type:complete